MKKNIALIGNPNSGKTTLFNALTGGSQRVGNWPGVTVEKKEGKLRQARDVTVTDLPGVYSLSPYSPEEEVSRRFLAEGSADAVINVVDATNLERNLILTLQLLEMGIPVTVALNMSDVVERRGDTVDEKKLSERLGCPVIRVSALKREGLENLAATVLEQASYGTRIPKKFFKCELSKAISEISGILEGHIDDDLLYWYSIKVMEHDPMCRKRYRPRYWKELWKRSDAQRTPWATTGKRSLRPQGMRSWIPWSEAYIKNLRRAGRASPTV